jgi:hypothetical protein
MSEHEPPIDLGQHPRRDDLARVVRTVALSAADERRSRFTDGLEEVMRELDLSFEDGKVGAINVLKALQRAEPPVQAGRVLIGRLLSLGVALEPPADAAAAERCIEALAWLAAHSYLDGLSALDNEVDADHAARLWTAAADLVRGCDQRGAVRGRAEALAAVAALARSSSPTARAASQLLGRELSDTLLRGVLGRAAPPGAAPENVAVAAIRGELVPVPLGPLGLVLQGVTGILLARYLWRFVARVILRCRRPAELALSPRAVTVKSTLDVLGRTVRQSETHIPIENLARAVREVRYPRLALYGGLTSLAIGTYLGVSLFVDGARVGSPSLIALGALIFAVGVIVDLVASSVMPTRRGRSRLIFVPRKGKRLALSPDDPSAAGALLAELGRGAV